MAETLDNAAVVSLVSAGLGDEAVIAKIKTSEAKYDLSSAQLIELKNKGVSGPVIAAMLVAATPAPKPIVLSMDSPDPMVPHAAGFYMLDGSGEPRMRRIDATVTNQAKTGGTIGFALTGGIASMSIKAAIPGESARVSAATSAPEFYLFFDESNANGAPASVWTAGATTTIQSPAELTLIALNPKDGRREARVGSTNLGGAKVGVMDKDRVSFDYDLIRPGVYRVKPQGTLRKGEYGFIYSITGGGAGGALSARIFDFSVR